MDRNTSTCFVCLLNFWYGGQKMQVCLNGVLSNNFHISNGVLQGGILSPYLFLYYKNSLSENLNRLRTGYWKGNNKLNRVFFADDICLLVPAQMVCKILLICVQIMLKRIRSFLTSVSQLVYFLNPNSFVFQLLKPFFSTNTVLFLIIR